jgi:hypothetical protein
MFELNLRLADHMKRYTISAVTPSGWEVCFEEDQQVRRRNLYEDWHRVERALASFQREALALTEHGWLIV